jgi:thymidylate synthase (FAD)
MKAELIDYMGDDLLVVNAARVSFKKEVGTMSTKDSKLLNYLAKHNHWTPFSHPQICMRETVPIFVARQRFKHMVGFTYNEVSRRYVDDEPEFYTPDSWRSRPEGSVKQGSGSDIVDTVWMRDPVEPFSMPIDNAYDLYTDQAKGLYESMLVAGVSPEQARMVLPQSMLTSYYVTGSLAAWARAYKQRIDAHAQEEIRDLAVQWDKVIAPLFPESWPVLTTNH